MKKGIVARLDSVNEFEREPVPVSKLKSFKNFLGMYAGEHTAGTEFVIGPLFVAHGVSAIDLVVGLLVGNLLAVLSWAFLTAPIAVKTRVTMYFQLEKICGTGLVKVYNIVNGLMFCFLAGSMIAVSATAVGIPFGIPMPSLNDLYPNSVSWVITVFAIGSITTIVAMFGYSWVSKFSNIAAPWMILIFFAAAIASLPHLGVEKITDFWAVANEKIWTGNVLPGQSKFTLWHVVFFSWFANMAMHIGMSDLSILRYAKKWQYGFTSATGMFVGHYFAWIASGILYALFLQQSGQSTEFAPGVIAFQAAGIAGAVCVVIAGWTTANPTIYRAGLALQTINPSFKTWKVTLVTGLITTIAACFPALVMKLLDFVALYGLLLMPMGAVIFIDFWVLKRLSLQTNYAEKSGLQINWAAGLTWVVTLAICVLINMTMGVEIFFLGLPGWFIASLLYIVLSKVLQKKQLAF
ncbi:MAG: purine-cytosine permease family protein [Cyclobacteriaceae bacterium]